MIASKKLTEITKSWKVEMGVAIVVEASDITGVTLSCGGMTPINVLGIKKIAEDLLSIAKEIEEDEDFKKLIKT